MASPTTTAVCIFGVGARTPVGLTAVATAAAVRAGISRVQEHPRFVDEAGDSMMVGRDVTCAPFAQRERIAILAASAVEEALRPLPLEPTTSVLVLLALRSYGPGFNEQDAAWIGRAISTSLAARCVVRMLPIAEGHAAGFVALERARVLLSGGQADFCVVAGADSHLDADFLEALDEQGRLASASAKWGYSPGEGAGALLLGTRVLSTQLRKRPLAILRGVATSNEPAAIGTDEVCIGDGLSTVFRRLVTLVRYPAEKIGKQYCDLNGERYRNEEFMYTTQRVHPNAFEEMEDFAAPADAWGDVGAASAPLFAVLAVEAAARGYARGPFAMLWSGSEAGLRGGAVLELPVAAT